MHDVGYFDDNGKSVEKALMKTPIKSTFNPLAIDQPSTISQLERINTRPTNCLATAIIFIAESNCWIKQKALFLMKLA